MSSVGVHLYCAVRPGVEPGPEVEERAGRPVRSATAAGIDVWMGESEAPPRPTLDEIRRHHDVVAAAWEAAESCLPLRFGQWFEDVGKLHGAVRERASALRAGLERVRKAGEVSVRVLARSGRDRAASDGPGTPAGAEAFGDDPIPAGGTAPGGPGRAYLEGLRKRAAEHVLREERGDALAGELADALESHARQERRIPLEREDELMHVVVLFDRSEEEAINEGVDRIRSRHPDLDIRLTGPWPPWSFGP